MEINLTAKWREIANYLAEDAIRRGKWLQLTGVVKGEITSKGALANEARPITISWVLLANGTADQEVSLKFGSNYSSIILELNRFSLK